MLKTQKEKYADSFIIKKAEDTDLAKANFVQMPRKESE